MDCRIPYQEICVSIHTNKYIDHDISKEELQKHIDRPVILIISNYSKRQHVYQENFKKFIEFNLDTALKYNYNIFNMYSKKIITNIYADFFSPDIWEETYLMFFLRLRSRDNVQYKCNYSARLIQRAWNKYLKRKKMKNDKALIIQKYWKISISSPYKRLCRSRLEKEFNEIC